MCKRKSDRWFIENMAEQFSYIGWSNDSGIRYRATSGGVGSTLVKYCFEKRLISHALSFEFDQHTLRYYPVLAKSFADYRITASIYQEMDMWSFFRNNLTRDVVGGGQVLLFCLPCQTVSIRKIAAHNGVNVILVGLTCSSQQDFDATKYLLKNYNISPSDVTHVQYRGNGWPSGVQISLKTGKTIIVPNLDSIWTGIFHSRLFIPKRCFLCTDTLNDNADLTLADPWLPQYIKSETIGKTLVRANTDVGERLLSSCLHDGYLTLEKITHEDIVTSQKFTIDRKFRYRDNKRLVLRFAKLFSNVWYRKLILNTRLGYRVHEHIKNLMERRLA